jgi:GntR family transcriptional repressor for pyruvate dehydrogenase complex
MAAGDVTLNKSQTDVVIDAIKRMLRDGTLHAGSRLPIERELAATLGVSRGSLREAIRALAALGVLEARQGDGTYVTSLDPAKLLSPIGFFAELHEPSSALELLAVRRVLEVESVSLATTRLTSAQLDELEAILASVDQMLSEPDTVDAEAEATIDADAAFHRAIAGASGNSALSALIENLMSRTLRARLWRAITERDSVREAHSEHRAILRALVARDADRARVHMSAHIMSVEEFLSTHPDVPVAMAEGP